LQQQPPAGGMQRSWAAPGRPPAQTEIQKKLAQQDQDIDQLGNIMGNLNSMAVAMGTEVFFRTFIRPKRNLMCFLVA